jgi:hypothetical protein
MRAHNALISADSGVGDARSQAQLNWSGVAWGGHLGLHGAGHQAAPCAACRWRQSPDADARTGWSDCATEVSPPSRGSWPAPAGMMSDRRLSRRCHRLGCGGELAAAPVISSAHGRKPPRRPSRGISADAMASSL